VLKGDDKEAITGKTQTLAELSGKITQQAYSQAGEGGPDTAGFTEAAQAANEKGKDKQSERSAIVFQIIRFTRQ